MGSVQNKKGVVLYMYNSYYFKWERERTWEMKESEWKTEKPLDRAWKSSLSLLSKLRLVGVSLSSLSHGYGYYLYKWVSVGLRVKVEKGFYGWGQGLTVFTRTWDGKGILIIRTVRFNATLHKTTGCWKRW